MTRNWAGDRDGIESYCRSTRQKSFQICQIFRKIFIKRPGRLPRRWFGSSVRRCCHCSCSLHRTFHKDTCPPCKVSYLSSMGIQVPSLQENSVSLQEVTTSRRIFFPSLQISSGTIQSFGPIGSRALSAISRIFVLLSRETTCQRLELLSSRIFVFLKP